jgi:hypothetical protein
LIPDASSTGVTPIGAATERDLADAGSASPEQAANNVAQASRMKAAAKRENIVSFMR